jgi:molybdenum cofactor cytidylyltransferase
MLAAVILSGGASLRMGSPKALLPFQGRPFLEHLLDITNHPKIGARRVVLGAHAEDIARGVPLQAGEVVVNDRWEEGQLSSIHAGLKTLPAETEGMVLCLIDHPLISRALVDGLIGQFYSTRAPVVLPVFEGKRGHPVIFSSAVFGELENAPAHLGARSVVWAHKGRVVEYMTAEEGCVLNLNDPEGYARMTRGR